MIEISNKQISGFSLGPSTNGTVYVGNTQVWPLGTEYYLRDLTITYYKFIDGQEAPVKITSSSEMKLHPNCKRFAVLGATLYTKVGNKIITSTVNVQAFGSGENDNYVKQMYSFDWESLGSDTYSCVTANYNKRTTEYTNQNEEFGGYYTIDGNIYYVKKSSNTSQNDKIVIPILANSKTVTTQYDVTTSINYPAISRRRLSAYDDPGTTVNELQSEVSCIRYYDHYFQKTVWTSEVQTLNINGTETEITSSTKMYEERNMSLPQTSHPITPQVSEIDPTPAGLISVTKNNNVITGTSNNTTSVRSWKVGAKYDDPYTNVTFYTPENEAETLEQSSNEIYYGDFDTVNLISNYTLNNLIPASGASGNNALSLSVSYRQPYYWKGSSDVIGYKTSGITKDNIKYYYYDATRWVQLTTNNDGSCTVTIDSKGPHTSTVTYNGETYGATFKYKVEVTNGGRTGSSNEKTICQEKNEVTGINAVVTILNTSNNPITNLTYNFPALPGSNDKFNFKAKSERYKTYTSGYTDPSGSPSETITSLSSFTITKSDWLTVSYSSNAFPVTVTARENSGNAKTGSSAGSVIIKDTSYPNGNGTKTITMTQNAATYNFAVNGSNSFNIAYNELTFDVMITSTLNGHFLAMDETNIQSITGGSDGNLNASNDVNSFIAEDNTGQYTYRFTCTSNTTSSTRSSIIVFKQKNTGNTLTVTVTQAKFVSAQLSLRHSSTDSNLYTSMDTTGGSTCSFQVKCDKTWQIATYNYNGNQLNGDGYYAACKYNGYEYDYDQAYITARIDDGYATECAGDSSWHTVHVIRGSFDSRYPFVGVVIKVKNENSMQNFLITPPYSLSTSYTSSNPWKPVATGASITGITIVGYPESSVEWNVSDTWSSWLSASGTMVTVQSHTSTSTRPASGNAYATASISMPSSSYFDINLPSSTSVNVYVQQQAAAAQPTTKLHVFIRPSDPNTLYLGKTYMIDLNSTVESTEFQNNLVQAPAGITITNLQIKSNGGDTYKYVTTDTTIKFAEGDSFILLLPRRWTHIDGNGSSTPSDVKSIVSSSSTSTVSWTISQPSYYELATPARVKVQTNPLIIN